MPVGKKERSAVEIGVRIPPEILQRKELTDRKKIILSAILQLYRNNRKCFAKNEYFSRWLGIPQKRVSEDINLLAKEHRLIESKVIYKGNQFVERQLTPNYRALKVKPKYMKGVSRISGEGIP